MLKEILEKVQYDGIGVLNEATFNRILDVINNDKIDFIIMSGFKPWFSKKENLKRNNEILKSLRNVFGKEIGAYKFVGHWKECSIEIDDYKDMKDLQDKCIKQGGKIVDSLEESLLIRFDNGINNDIFEEILKIVKQFQQEAFVMRRDGQTGLYGNDGSEYLTFKNKGNDLLQSSFKVLLDKQGYSQWKDDRKKGKNRNIVFEFYKVEAKTNFGKQLFRELNLL